MAEDSESDLDTIVQGGDPVTEPEKPAEKAAEIPEKKGMSQTLVAILIGIGTVIVVGYMYVSGNVEKKNAELEQEYINRKKEYVIQAHRRMYDTLQGQLQAEMMDRTATNPQPDSTNPKDFPSPPGASHGTE